MNEERYNTLWLRFCAGFIDLIVVLPFLLAISLLNYPRFSWASWLLVFAMVLVNTTYFVVMHARSGQTIGKKAMKVRVVDSTTEGMVSFQQSVWRESPLIAINVLFFATESVIILTGAQRVALPLAMIYLILQPLPNLWYLADALTSLFNPKRRTIHDYIGKTVVVKEDEANKAPEPTPGAVTPRAT